MGNEWKYPVFTLCNGLDKERTVLLGAFVKPEWFCTMKVCIKGNVLHSKIHNCKALMPEHCKLSLMTEREVSSILKNNYILSCLGSSVTENL